METSCQVAKKTHKRGNPYQSSATSLSAISSGGGQNQKLEFWRRGCVKLDMFHEHFSRVVISRRDYLFYPPPVAKVVNP